MKPILFNTDMVRAILDGRKTVTRRVVKPQPNSKLAYACMGYKHGTWGYPDKNAWKYWDDESYKRTDGIAQEELEHRWTPPCHTGDILYVRETFFTYKGRYYYKADGNHEKLDELVGASFFKWRPSIHMPKEEARLFLRVTDVRVERLQDITEEQAKAEGANWKNGKNVGVVEKMRRSAIERFAEIWDATIKSADLDTYGWAANPWVWAIEFKRISKEGAE